MNITRTLWRVQLASIRNAARYDSRIRFALVLVTFFDIALGYWSGSQLMMHITQWKTLGPAELQSGLWSICLLTWLGMSLVATLEFLQQGLGNDASLLLFTLPIAPNTRFCAQFGMFFINRLWNWLLLEICITGWVLFVTLGWPQAISWLLLLQLGVACVVYATMVALMLLICYILPYFRAKARVTLWTVLALVMTVAFALIVHPPLGTKVMNSVASIAGATNTLLANYLGWLKPASASLLLALLLLLILGPLARWTGNIYTAAFLVTQGWDRSQRAFYLPGIGLLSGLLARQRTLTGALLVKGLLNQSRNFLFWARLAILVITLAFFQQVHTLVTTHGLSDIFFTIGYASILAFVLTFEQAPNAISGEGNRLSLYLTAPFSSAAIFLAKLATFILPATMAGLATDLFLSWRIGLPLTAIVYNTIAIVLVISGCIAPPVLGSIWEENLNLPVEGTIQIILQEEAAVSPKRLLLVYLSVLLLAVSLLILWKLPPILALATLLSLDITIVAAMLQLSRTYLRQLIRAG
jgi:hypothetical protein